MSFVIFTLGVAVVSYPFFGAIVYGDPWTWIFKEKKDV